MSNGIKSNRLSQTGPPAPLDPPVDGYPDINGDCWENTREVADEVGIGVTLYRKKVPCVKLPPVIDQPVLGDPQVPGHFSSGGTGGGGNYVPPGCNPDPNYKVPSYPPPAGKQWPVPCPTPIVKEPLEEEWDMDIDEAAVAAMQANQLLKYCNFNFQESLGVNWQAAGIRGIGIILANEGPLMFNIEIGLPIYSAALKRNIGRLEAQRASAAAYGVAIWKVNALYAVNKITPAAIPNRVASEMQKALNKTFGFTDLKLNVARVSTQLGINEGAPISTANFNLDCK